MNDSFKKILNICSYLLNGIFIILLIISFLNKHSYDNSIYDEDDLAQENERDYDYNNTNESDLKEKTVNSIDFYTVGQGIIKREEKELPLRIQKFKVDDITIDDIVITDKTNRPYSGYMETTWYYKKKAYVNGSYPNKSHQKTVYVKVFDIDYNLDGYSWRSDWGAAYVDICTELIGIDWD